MQRTLGLAAILTLAACGEPEATPLSWGVARDAVEAKPDEAREVAERLGSRDPVEVLWGAYLAGDRHVTAVADALLGMLDDGPMAREAALDALARMGSPVPAEKVRSIYDAALEHGDEVLAMTAMAVALRDPAAHRDLVALGFDEALVALDEDGWESWRGALTRWRGYANALASLRDQQLTASLVGMLETDISVEVVSPGIGIARGSCGGCGGAYSTSCMGLIGGYSPYPPRGSWHIDDRDDDACSVMLPGPTDVCLVRREIGPLTDRGEEVAAEEEDNEPEQLALADDEPWVEAEEAIEPERRDACPPDDATSDRADELEVQHSQRNQELLSYLSALTGEEQRFDGVLSAVHVWRGEARYREAMDGLRERVRGEHHRLVRVLEQAYLLPAGYQAPRLAIRATTSDDRACEVTAPLPR